MLLRVRVKGKLSNTKMIIDRTERGRGGGGVAMNARAWDFSGVTFFPTTLVVRAAHVSRV